MTAVHMGSDAARAAVLRSHGLLGDVDEPQFADIVRLAAAVCATPMAALTLVDLEEQVLLAHHGYGEHVGPASRRDSLCSRTIQGLVPFEVPDARVSFADSAFVTGELGIRGYTGVPVTVGDGVAIGALCVADTSARTLEPHQLEVLCLLAAQVERLLAHRQALRASQVLGRLSAVANAATHAAPVLLEALAEICDHTGWVRGTAYLLDPASGRRTAAGAHGGGVEPGTASFVLPVEQSGTHLAVLEFARSWDSAPGGETPDPETTQLLADIAVVLARVVERQRATCELARREERLRRLVDSARDAFVAMDADGIVTEWNQQAVELLGWSREQAIGSELVALVIPPELRDAHSRGFARFLDTRVPVILDHPVEVPARRRDGSTLPVELTVWLTGEQDALEFNAFVRDVSARHEVERLLREEIERKEQLVAELQSVDRLKNDVVTTVSHEFRTPLTSMLGYLELLVDDSAELDPLHQQALSAVHRNSHRLKRLVDNLVTVARLDSGALQLTLVEFDLAKAVGRAVDAHEQSVADKGLRLDVQLEPVGHMTGDRELVERLVANLLSNAVKFTSAEGSVRVVLRTEGATAVIEVQDTGTGIAAAEQESVFGRFHRGEAAELDAIQGSGIGLSIVREVAEAHGGSVELSSELGTGTRVRVTLPLGPAFAVAG